MEDMDNYVWELLVNTLSMSHNYKEQIKKEILGEKKPQYTKRTYQTKLKKLNKEKGEVSDRIIDLGSSPGSWSQVVVEYNNNAKITAIDLLEMKFHHKNIEFIKNDFTKINFNSFKENFDLILSDLAPNTTGHQSTDHLKISAYVLNVISIIDIIANQNSNFITKIWKGSEEKLILKELESKFKNVSYFKPNSSRKNSSEIYLIAQNFN
mgnify:CR=1 FL=1